VAYDPNALKGALQRVGGSKSDDWNDILANQTVRTLWLEHSDKETCDRQYSATIAALVGIGPKDEIEGMIAAQLIAAHNAAMESYRRATLGGQTLEGRRENLDQANKLARTCATLLESLNRHRGKGQQKVTVEHVHVYQGGQAIVGHVKGGGVTTKAKEQPHAITNAPGAEMPSEDTPRKLVPVTGNEERSMPDARRKITRRTKRK
jgi:hypothetical protein